MAEQRWEMVKWRPLIRVSHQDSGRAEMGNGQMASSHPSVPSRQWQSRDGKWSNGVLSSECPIKTVAEQRWEMVKWRPLIRVSRQDSGRAEMGNGQMASSHPSVPSRQWQSRDGKWSNGVLSSECPVKTVAEQRWEMVKWCPLIRVSHQDRFYRMCKCSAKY